MSIPLSQSNPVVREDQVSSSQLVWEDLSGQMHFLKLLFENRSELDFLVSSLPLMFSLWGATCLFTCSSHCVKHCLSHTLKKCLKTVASLMNVLNGGKLSSEGRVALET